MMDLQFVTPIRSLSASSRSDSFPPRSEAAKNDRIGLLARGKSGIKERKAFWEVVAYGARPGKPGGLLSAWWLWERIANRLWPSFAAPDLPYGLLRIRVATYRGRPINLPDSTRVDTGTTVCELHCDNDAILNFSRQTSAIYVAGRGDLIAIANWVSQSESCVKAIFGVTLLGVAAARLGFYRRPVCSGGARAQRLFMNGLLALYSIDGVARLKRGRTLSSWPQEIWMSRGELLRRYGSPRWHPHRADPIKHIFSMAVAKAEDPHKHKARPLGACTRR